MSTTTAETLYTFRTPHQDVLVRGRANKVSMPVYRSNALVAPTQSGSTFSLIAPNGTVIVDAQAVTVTGSVATYTIPALSLPSTLTLGEGYQERWVLVLTDRTETVDREAGLCVRPLTMALSEADLRRRYTNLSRLLAQGVTSVQDKLDAAWEEILRRLWREGVLPYGVKSPDQLSDSHRCLTMAILYEDCALAQPNAAVWTERAKDARDQYERSWAPQTWRTDGDLDGVVDDPNKRQGAGEVIQIGGSPPYTALTARSMGV